MKLGTVTSSVLLSDENIKNIKRIYNFEILFIQYKEDPLYNMSRSTIVVGDAEIIESANHFNILRYKDTLILQCNILNEEELWDLIDQHDFDFIIGFFNEDADENIHFELTFEYKDSYKDICHDQEIFPEFTDKVNQIRDTWILNKKDMNSGIFELDVLINGVWIDVSN